MTLSVVDANIIIIIIIIKDIYIAPFRHAPKALEIQGYKSWNRTFSVTSARVGGFAAIGRGSLGQKKERKKNLCNLLCRTAKKDLSDMTLR